MKKQWILGVVLAAVLALPGVGAAHEGHNHKVIGTVTSVQGTNLMVKTTDGKSTMVMLDAKTTVTQGKAKVQAASLKVGDRIVAEGPEAQGMVTAQTIRVGAATPAAAARPATKAAPAHAHADGH
jgi:hypothetical protein